VVLFLHSFANAAVLSSQIQHTIQEEFADSLVITIAHRLSTVVSTSPRPLVAPSSLPLTRVISMTDYDKVLVLDHGSLVEFDSPQNLLRREGGSFRRMCEKAADWEELKAKAGL
jgi:ABC-type multidrug transport system fused ATPase/permease subunit